MSNNTSPIPNEDLFRQIPLLRDMQQQLKDANDRIAALESQISKHSHTGFDTSKVIHGTLTLAGSSSFKIGDLINLSVGSSPTPAFLNIGGGFQPSLIGAAELISNTFLNTASPPISMADLYEGKTNVQTNLNDATRWAGFAVSTSGANTANESRQLIISLDKFDPHKGETSSPNSNEELAQISLVRQNLTPLGSYIAGFQGPKDDGIGAVTFGGTTITDTSKHWVTNQFTGAHVFVFDSISFSLASTTVASNTNNVITTTQSLPYTGSLPYSVFFPIANGSAFYPWKNLRLGHQGTVRGMGTGSRGFVLYNPKNTTNKTVSGTPLTVEIQFQGTPYYFLVYPTSSA